MIQKSKLGLKFFARRFRRHVYLRDLSIAVVRDILQSRYLRRRVAHKQLARTSLILGRFPFEKNSGNSGLWSEWNGHFPEFLSEILGVSREVGLKFRKIGITGKFRSIRPFLLGPSFSEPGNRNSTWLILKLLNIILVLYQTKDRNILLQRYCNGLASQALVSSAKIQSYRT